MLDPGVLNSDVLSVSSSGVGFRQMLLDVEEVRRLVLEFLGQHPKSRDLVSLHVQQKLSEGARERLTLNQLSLMLEVLTPPLATDSGVGRVLEVLSRNPDLKARVRQALLDEGGTG